MQKQKFEVGPDVTIVVESTEVFEKPAFAVTLEKDGKKIPGMMVEYTPDQCSVKEYFDAWVEVLSKVAKPIDS